MLLVSAVRIQSGVSSQKWSKERDWKTIPKDASFLLVQISLCLVNCLALRRADFSSSGVLPSVVCLRMISTPKEWGGLSSSTSHSPKNNKNVKLRNPNFNICFVWRRIIWWRYYRTLPIPVPARSKAWVCCRSPAEIVGSNPTGGIDVCCECCVLSDRGLCEQLITRPEESYRLWCIVVCDPGTS
jgi:hypothetical protein